MYLSHTESVNYHGETRAELRALAARMARRQGRRYAQVVGSDGRILDCIEVAL